MLERAPAMGTEKQPTDESIRASFCAVFRAAPPGAEIYVPHPASWCTSIASKVHRKIRTQSFIGHPKRGGSSLEMTRVTFLGEVKTKRSGPLHDPRQILVPGLDIDE